MPRENARDEVSYLIQVEFRPTKRDGVLHSQPPVSRQALTNLAAACIRAEEKMKFLLIPVLVVACLAASAEARARLRKRETNKRRLSSRRTKLAGYEVTVSEPDDIAGGVTFFLPGAMASESMYQSNVAVLLEQKQVVISFASNVLTTSHEEMAERVPKIFDAYIAETQADIDQYSVVGHSVGGKVSLLLAAKVDPERVKTAISLDPVDSNPAEFTSDGDSNLTLEDASAPVYITWAAATTWGIPKEHNAFEIHSANKQWIQPLIVHTGAAHLAYTDNGGGWLNWLFPGGTREGDDRARAETHRLIREVI